MKLDRSIPLVGLAAIVLTAATVSCSDAGSVSATGDNLCSTDGLMSLIPELENSDGKFEIPDPTTDLAGFLKVQQGLTNAIDVQLVKASVELTAQSAAENVRPAMTFQKEWRSAEIGVSTNGKAVSFPDGGALGSYGGASFLSGIEPVAGSSNAFFQITKPDGSVPALVSAVPTVLPCVNRLMLASATTAGTWLPPTYALGDEDGNAYLIVDLCVDLAASGQLNKQPVLKPTAKLFTAIQWADTPETSHMNSDAPARQHGG
ncbi:MAG: hypothetical protein HQ526_06670 [Actinobacteria bacterium]|nr:hypothetical protein [Actinomycetota bacterium]